MKKIIFETKDLKFNDSISFPDTKLNSSDVTFITGESGIGKSTFLKLLNKTLSHSSGHILYNGTDIDLLDSVDLRKEISLINQEVFLFDTSINENFKIFYDFRGQKPLSEEEIKYYLEICCMPAELTKDCTTMSGGERHRVYMAIFLSFCPNVIMLDEPTSALDNKNSVEIIGNIINYCKQKNISVIIVSHDSDLTEKFADNIISLKKKT